MYQPVLNQELSFECKNLINTDFSSKTDTQIICKLKNVETLVINELGLTEVVWDSLNPKFTTKFKVEGSFIEILDLIVEVYDTEENEVKNNIPKINTNRLIGYSQVDLISVSKSYGKKVKLDILDKDKKNKKGELQVYTEPLNDSRQKQTMKIKASKIKKNSEGPFDWLFSDTFRPFLNFYKITEGNEWIKTYQVKLKQDDKQQTCHSFDILDTTLNNGDEFRAIKIELVHRKMNEEEQYQDHCECTISELSNGKFKFHFECNKNASISFSKFEKKQNYKFNDQLQYGLNINLIIGIDYTASNGDPRNSNTQSLHSITSNTLNQYQNSLNSVGSILIQYDSDKTVPMQGFGCKFNNNPTNHAFNIHANMGMPNGFIGLQSINEAYVNFTSNPYLVLSGPTNFTPILQEITNQININDFRNYQIIMMLTDGQITDFRTTVDFLVKCSTLPISVIIIGVGNADFTQMRALDNDDGKLKDSKGNGMTRDCVQFVDFKSCKDMDKLRQEVLMELPAQIEKQQNSIKKSPEDVYKSNTNQSQLMGMGSTVQIPTGQEELYGNQ